MIIHHRDAEDTEIAQRKAKSLCPLCGLCASVESGVGKSHHRDTENTEGAQSNLNLGHYPHGFKFDTTLLFI
jgi:hypothetical protein